MQSAGQGCESGSGSWKRKRLIFCGSGNASTLMEEVGSGSELGFEEVGIRKKQC